MKMLLRTLYLPLFLMPLAASCSMGATRVQDQMCAQLAAFAAMTKPAQSHSVVLRGGWGGDTPNTLMTHDCQHSGYEPGKLLCAYLVKNTSWEFGNYNVERAAACLDSASRQDFIRRMGKYEVPAEITSSMQLLADKNVQVTVRLEASPSSAAKRSNLSALTLSAAHNSN